MGLYSDPGARARALARKDSADVAPYAINPIFTMARQPVSRSMRSWESVRAPKPKENQGQGFKRAPRKVGAHNGALVRPSARELSSAVRRRVLSQHLAAGQHDRLHRDGRR
jgi:hypothetical protein